MCVGTVVLLTVKSAKMGPEKSPAVINQNRSKDIKKPCYKEHLKNFL